MSTYPVHYHVDRPEHFSRLQLAIRILAFLALGVLGISFGLIFAFAYLALPAYAASRLSAASPGDYASKDGPRVLRALHWLAAVSAWAGLIAERLPGHAPDEEVHIAVDPQPSATASAALWRVATGLPSALVLAALCWIGVFVWLWAALSVLLTERVGHRAFRYLEGLQRWSIRLLAYQASLVSDYPPFSFADQPASLARASVVSR